MGRTAGKGLSRFAFFITICVVLLSIGVGAATAHPLTAHSPTVENNATQPLGINTDEEEPTTEEVVTAESAAFDSEQGEYTAQTARTNVELDQELRLVPEQKGIYEVSHQYELPDHLVELEVTLPETATVASQDGFVQTEEQDRYRWDGQTPQPEIDYQLQGNRSIDQTGPIAGPGRLLFADVGEWAIVSQPSTGHQWGWTGGPRVGFDRSVSAEQGAIGDVIAYLGEYEKLTHEAHDQEFTLVVPERAELAEEPDDIFESLSDASDTLRVGERDEEVFMIATPTQRIDWGVRGLQTGPADLWTRDNERLDTADNVWLHEYVHTRQGYASAQDLRWFTEGGATYYAALLTLKQDRIDFEDFSDRLAVGTNEQRFREAVLNDPDTWRSNIDYHVGALVSGELDRQLRLASDGERSLQDVFRRLNAKDGVADAETFRRFVRDTGDESVAAESDRLTGTTERPAMWDSDAHRDAFGGPLSPARITYALASEDTPSVSGPFRNRTLGEGETLVPGETVSLVVNATNFGEQPGDYRVRFRVNDDLLATQRGSLNASESAEHSFDHTVETTGEFRLSIGNMNLPVSVREPAEPTVGNLSVDRSEIEPGETITLSAVARNQAERPAAGTVSFFRNAEQFHSTDVRLDIDGERMVTIETQIDEPGTYVFGLGEQPDEMVAVTVAEVDEPTEASTTSQVLGLLILSVAVFVAAIGLALLLWRKD